MQHTAAGGYSVGAGGAGGLITRTPCRYKAWCRCRV